jgi:hypothetical protein
LDGHEGKKGTTHMDGCPHAGMIKRRGENERRGFPN